MVGRWLGCHDTDPSVHSLTLQLDLLCTLSHTHTHTHKHTHTHTHTHIHTQTKQNVRALVELGCDPSVQSYTGNTAVEDAKPERVSACCRTSHRGQW